MEITMMKIMSRTLSSAFTLWMLFFTASISASSIENKIVLIALDSIIIPILIQNNEANETQDTVAPLKPVFTIQPPTETSQKDVLVEIQGEVDTSIFVNGVKVSTLSSSGRAIISLDTSGADGRKDFTIVLKDSSGNVSTSLTFSITKVPDPKFDISYKGLTLYHQNMSPSDYALNQLDDSKFNALNPMQKLQVANTLLSTLFFGYPQKELKEKINSGHFISGIQSAMNEDTTDKAWLENHILDDDIFTQYDRWNEPQAINILTRFYAMKDLDSYFLKNWTAYILTQTIMFSPAYELESTHTPNISNIYNRIVTFLNEESGMRYITYVHMMSEDNWRRFRSPEDNGREMLEIFQFDMDDSHVPIAGKALQNWKLNTDGDTLEVGLNQNTEPLNLFGTIVTNGDDFYRELVKADLFTKGVTRRLVDFFFPKATKSKKEQLTHTIVSSQPETWQDILLQIVFSEAYLLENTRAKSAEENFFSLAKKIDFKHNKSTFYYLKESLEEMHQASMKYKLGKLNRVPLDTLSFAHYHKYIREEVLLRKSNPKKLDEYSAWSRHGWGRKLVSLENFSLNENNTLVSLDSFIHSLFHTFVYRNATQAELAFFRTHMIYNEEDDTYFHWAFNMLDTYDDAQRQTKEREERRTNIAIIVLDYLSRLENTYLHREIN